MTGYANIPGVLRAQLANAGPGVLALLDSWCGIRKGQLIPNRRDFDPATVTRFLGMVYLYRYEPAIGDFVCRLAGEQINDAWELRIKGLAFRQVVSEEHHPAALERWRAIIDEPLVQYGRFTEQGRNGDECVGERMNLPLSGDSGRGEFVLGMAVYKASQADRDWINPVWDDVIRVPCAEIPYVGASDT